MEAVEEVVVLYEYSAQLPDELSLRVGDVITRVERMEGGWWKGRGGTSIVSCTVSCSVISSTLNSREKKLFNRNT